MKTELKTYSLITLSLSGFILAICSILFLILEYEIIQKDEQSNYSEIPKCWDHQKTELGNLIINNCVKNENSEIKW